MNERFVLLSELDAWRRKHPEYNNFVPIKDKYNELIGYNCTIVEEK